MADLIDRQAAKEKLRNNLMYMHLFGADRSITLIDEVPSEDAVEVVRCRDCKHNPNDTWFECPISHLPYKEDRWCWKGERKDG